MKKLGQDHPNTTTVLNNFYAFLQQALVAGRSDRLSNYPLTQFRLQQLQKL